MLSWRNCGFKFQTVFSLIATGYEMFRFDFSEYNYDVKKSVCYWEWDGMVLV